MGNSSSNSCPPPMKIHGLHGKFLKVSPDRLVATRFDGYADAMFFGSRVVSRDEKIELTIQKMTKDWNGSLRFGFTSHDPVAICNHPEGIPRFMCPDLVKRGGSFIETLNHIKLLVGDRIVFWVTPAGDIRLSVNEVVQRSQVTRLVTQPVWPVVDVYGNAVEIKFRSLSDDPDQLEDVKSARYYSSLNLVDLQFSGNRQSIDIRNGVSMLRKDIHKAFVWNESYLPINHVWFLFINEVDNTQGKNLSIAILTSPPNGGMNAIPDNLQKFSGRPSVFENIYSRNVVGDEVAICVINNGAVMVALNGDDFELLGTIPKNDHYWFVADMNCIVKGATSLGFFPLTKDPLPLLPNVKGSCLPRERNIQSDNVPIAESNNGPSFGSNHSASASAAESMPMERPAPVEVKCLSCKKEKPNHVFIKCGHVCCCQGCSDKIMKSSRKCPSCGLRVEKHIRVFF